MLVKYVRIPNSRIPVGCVVGLFNGSIGWSQCCPKDNFSKKLAKEIALGRAVKNASKFSPPKIAYTQMRNDGYVKVFKEDLITPEIEKMKAKLERVNTRIKEKNG